MKKMLAIALILTCLLCLVGYGANTAKDKEELATYLSNEHGVDQNRIQYAGEYANAIIKQGH